MNGTNPKSTASIAGHPIHPMLIPFPVVFLVTAFVTDIVFWSTGYEIWATASVVVSRGRHCHGLSSQRFSALSIFSETLVFATSVMPGNI